LILLDISATVPPSSIASYPSVSLGNLTSAPISSVNSLTAASSIIPVGKSFKLFHENVYHRGGIIYTYGLVRR
jgi:hypothetical protein